MNFVKLAASATILIVGFLSLAACNPPKGPSSEQNQAETATTPIVVGQSFTIASEATGLSHEINVWTPPELGKDGQTYPVLYVIDGGLDQDFHHISGLAQLSTINGRFETPIVVGIRTSNRYYQLTPKMTDRRYLPWNETDSKPEMGGADDFHRFITKDVMSFIDSNYPNNDRKILMGESLAGFFIIREFLRNPENFTDYVAISPSLWLDDQKLAKEATALLAQHKDTNRNLYLTMGDEGGTMQAGLDRLISAVENRNFDNLNMIYVDRRESETHSTIYHGAALDALIKFFGIPVPDYGPAPWYLREGGHPEEDN